MASKPPSKASKSSKSSSSKPVKSAPKSSKPYKHRKRDEVKARPSTTDLKKKKKPRTYNDAELAKMGVPKLNMITPAGVQKPKGKKKGKVFVDDQESMMTILAMVNADKEGQIESKMMRARQMEEIREARAREAEKRKEGKREKLEETKDSLRKHRKRKVDGVADAALKDAHANAAKEQTDRKKSKKRVSFG